MTARTTRAVEGRCDRPNGNVKFTGEADAGLPAGVARAAFDVADVGGLHLAGGCELPIGHAAASGWFAARGLG